MTQEFDYYQEVKSFQSTNKVWEQIVESTNKKSELALLAEELQGRIRVEQTKRNYAETEDEEEIYDLYIQLYVLLLDKVVNKIK